MIPPIAGAANGLHGISMMNQSVDHDTSYLPRTIATGIAIRTLLGWLLLETVSVINGWPPQLLCEKTIDSSLCPLLGAGLSSHTRNECRINPLNDTDCYYIITFSPPESLFSRGNWPGIVTILPFDPTELRTPVGACPAAAFPLPLT